MTISTTIVKHGLDPRSYAALPVFHQSIHAEDKNKLFALFFRNYDNRYKYCNTVSYSLEDQELQKEYRVWLSDINNYANNGGDTW